VDEHVRPLVIRVVGNQEAGRLCVVRIEGFHYLRGL
jgi:hypothetical protein